MSVSEGVWKGDLLSNAKTANFMLYLHHVSGTVWSAPVHSGGQEFGHFASAWKKNSTLSHIVLRKQAL